ncbi:MAG: glutamine-hydrolyzing carbamoyl-phosphate synthase small subunit [archaeon]
MLGKEQKVRKAVLILEDGSLFHGNAFGCSTKVTGEIVFSTGMVGYTEALTDPSYRGQILTMTYPLVGNYGVPKTSVSVLPDCFESDGIKVSGLAVHSLCKKPSHWASTRTLNDWLIDEGIPGIYGIDTRALTKKLRDKGVMLGLLETCEAGEEPDLDKLNAEVKRIQDPNERDLVQEVTITQPITYPADKSGPRAVVVDCGVKYGIIRNLLRRGWEVVRVPASYTAGEILELRPSAVVISNGPGDPVKTKSTVQSTRQLIDEGVPIIGICLGVQILSLALGATTYKLKYGHRSQNQPALDLRTGRCYITTQNHGFAIDKNSLHGTGLEISLINANDQTVEGVKHIRHPCVGVQFHPEASPGPNDTQFMFDELLTLRGS